MKMKMQRSLWSHLFDCANYAFLGLLALSMVYPFFVVFSTSVAPNTEVYEIGTKLWPDHPTLDAYRMVLEEGYLATGYRNTILRTLIGTALSTLLTFTLGYALAKRDLPYRTGITLYFTFTMFFSGGLIPTYLLIKSLGLVNSFWVYIIPGLYSFWNAALMRNYIMSIPVDLSEAALVDGANPVTIMWRVMMPVCVPIIATIALFNAVGHWNAWFDCQVYISSRSKMVLQMLVRKIVIQSQLQEVVPSINVMMANQSALYTPASIEAATILLTIGPIVIAYPFVQKYFVKGIMVGSLKG
jgi:putative aldouronate transport system permease protein